MLEPYYDGSHRHLVDELRRRVVPAALLWTLPARKWKWRMRGSSLEFARRWREDAPTVDAVFASSMVNLAEFVGVAPRSVAALPRVAYFHENQLTYPVQNFDARDHHFAWTEVHTALAADLVLWNSAYNRDSFLAELERVVRKMPDARPEQVPGIIAARSRVLPVPVDVAAIEAETRDAVRREGPCHVVWNHRWEFDKGPDRLLVAARALAESGLEFEMSVVGQAFRDVPPEFEEIRSVLGSRLRRFGYVSSRAEYLATLASADVVLSTARHEFQGLAVIEAAAAGAVPLVPDALVYPESWPSQWRYGSDRSMVELLLDRVRRVADWRGTDPRPLAQAFGWTKLGPDWNRIFDLSSLERPG